MPLETLDDLFLHELRDLHDAERQNVAGLQYFAQAATAQPLRELFEAHLKETQEHLKRLDEVFRELGEKPEGRTCRAMQGLLAEGRELLDEDIDPDVLDAALVLAAQKIEHYEIAAYGSLATFARELGYRHAGPLLHTTLEEEIGADRKLTREAERRINRNAEA